LSCSDNNEQTQAPEQLIVDELYTQFEKQFKAIGVKAIYRNMSIPKNVKSSLDEMASSLVENKKNSYSVFYENGNKVTVYELDDMLHVYVMYNEHRILKKQLLFLEKDTEGHTLYSSSFNSNNDNIYRLYSKKDKFVLNKDELIASGGDCNELGRRRERETYNECFKRNWTNLL